MGVKSYTFPRAVDPEDLTDLLQRPVHIGHDDTHMAHGRQTVNTHIIHSLLLDAAFRAAPCF